MNPRLTDYYGEHRRSVEELYPSEKRFLPWLAQVGSRVVDVGCAAAGFRAIWRSYNRDIGYLGIDLSPAMLTAARLHEPEASLAVADSLMGLPIRSSGAEIVQALGWLHWEPRYRDALAELWRATARFLFFDVRLVDGEEDLHEGRQSVGPRSTDTVPYVCIAWPIFADYLFGLEPVTILGFGYWGRPAQTVVGAPALVYFSTFVLEKGGPDDGRPEACVGDLKWPASLQNAVDLWPGSLDELLSRRSRRSPK